MKNTLYPINLHVKACTAHIYWQALNQIRLCSRTLSLSCQRRSARDICPAVDTRMLQEDTVDLNSKWKKLHDDKSIAELLEMENRDMLKRVL